LVEAHQALRCEDILPPGRDDIPTDQDIFTAPRRLEKEQSTHERLKPIGYAAAVTVRFQIWRQRRKLHAAHVVLVGVVE